MASDHKMGVRVPHGAQHPAPLWAVAQSGARWAIGNLNTIGSWQLAK